jgi:uncharacterized BrkB/YihY/UPF0761 family membrane protein
MFAYYSGIVFILGAEFTRAHEQAAAAVAVVACGGHD